LLLSNTVLAEYEEVIKRESPSLSLTLEDADRLLDSLCLLAEPWAVSDRWLPVLTDPSDEALVQLAAESKADCLVTHNLRHLGPASRIGIKVLTPAQFLDILRESP
jgi:predicted nucleic acid-binding protein